MYIGLKGKDFGVIYPVKVTQINEDTIDCFDDYNDDRMRCPRTLEEIINVNVSEM